MQLTGYRQVPPHSEDAAQATGPGRFLIRQCDLVWVPKQSRPSFAGAPAVESPAGAEGAGSAGISDVARLEIHTQAALQNTSFNDTWKGDVCARHLRLGKNRRRMAPFHAE
jgi:hypothetical protein